MPFESSRHDSSHWTTQHSLPSEFALFTLIWLECMVSINTPFCSVQDESCLLLVCSNLNSTSVSRALLHKDLLCLMWSEFYVLNLKEKKKFVSWLLERCNAFLTMACLPALTSCRTRICEGFSFLISLLNTLQMHCYLIYLVMAYLRNMV